MKVTKKSNTRVQFTFDSDEQRAKLAKAVSYKVPGHQHSASFKTKLWDGTKCFLTATNTLSIGLFKSLFMEHALVYDSGRVPLTFDQIPLYAALPGLERRQYQLDAINAIFSHQRGIINSVMGSGKCLGKDTPIIMFDGTIKMVQNIIKGDSLLGPDGKKRNVISTTTGKDDLYKISPIKGDSYITNSVHLLSLKLTSGVQHNFTLSDGSIIDKNNTTNPIFVEAKTFYDSTTCKQWFKAWRPDAIVFEEETLSSSLSIPPYILGLWLGDGTSSLPELTNIDACVVKEFKDYATSIGCKIRDISSINSTSRYSLSKDTAKTNKFTDDLRRFKLLNNKHIPLDYKRASIQNRLELLAGLLDTDGSMSKNGFDFIQKSRELAEDVVFLCRSLGLAAYMKKCVKTIKSIGFSGTYYRISISGDCSIIPVRIGYKKAGVRQQKKNVLRTSITVEKAGHGDYYGFEIDGDRQFLLGDWQVTHNTLISAASCSYHLSLDPKHKVLFICYDRNILDQAIKTFKNYGFNVSQFGDGTKDLTGDIVVATIQSLAKILKPSIVLKNISFVITDESHHAKAKSSKSVITKLINCKYYIGLTATPHMPKTLDLAELMSVIGPVIFDYGFKQGVEDEKITPVKAFFLDGPVDLDVKGEVFDRKNYKFIWDTAIQYNEYRNNILASIISSLVDVLDTSNLVLVDRVEHGTALIKQLTNYKNISSVAMYGGDDIVMRDAKKARLMTENINTLVSTVVTEGVDFKISPVVAVNASGRKSFIKLIQFLGRVTRPNEKFKKFRVLIDSIDNYHPALRVHSHERIKACENFGLEVVTCKSVQELLVEIVKYYKECNN